MNQKQGGQVRFIRKGGRIIPIRVRQEASAARDLKREVRRKPNQLGTPLLRAGTALAGGLGLGYTAGRLSKIGDKLKGFKGIAATRSAKFLDYGSKFGVGLVAAGALASFDRRTNKDERSSLLNVGEQARTPVQVGAALVGGYTYYRLQKRFVKWGQIGGKFPTKLKGI